MKRSRARWLQVTMVNKSSKQDGDQMTTNESLYDILTLSIRETSGF